MSSTFDSTTNPLVVACQSNDHDRLEILIKEWSESDNNLFDLNPIFTDDTRKRTFTPFQYAASQNWNQICLLLAPLLTVEQINVQTDVGSALNIPAAKGYVDIIKILLQPGVLLDVRHDQEETALMMAASNQQWSTCLFLIPHMTSDQLMNRHRRNNKHAGEIALEHGAPTDVIRVMTVFGTTAMWMDWRKTMGDKFEKILPPVIEPFESGSFDFEYFRKVHAVVADLPVALDKLLEVNEREDPEKLVHLIEIALRDENYHLLHIFASNGVKWEVISEVMMNDFGAIAMHKAIEHKLLDVIHILLKRNVDVSIRDDEGNQAIHKAVVHELTDIIRLLQNNGADIYIMNQAGKSAMDLAVEKDHPELLAVLKNSASATEEKEEKKEPKDDFVVIEDAMQEFQRALHDFEMAIAGDSYESTAAHRMKILNMRSQINAMNTRMKNIQKLAFDKREGAPKPVVAPMAPMAPRPAPIPMGGALPMGPPAAIPMGRRPPTGLPGPPRTGPPMGPPAIPMGAPIPAPIPTVPMPAPAPIPGGAPIPGMGPMAPMPAPVPAPFPMGAPIPAPIPMGAPFFMGAPMPMGAPIPVGAPMPAPPPPFGPPLLGPPMPRRKREKKQKLFVSMFDRSKNYEGAVVLEKKRPWRYIRPRLLVFGFVRFEISPRNMTETGTIDSATRELASMIATFFGRFSGVRPKPPQPMRRFYWRKLKPRDIRHSKFWIEIEPDPTLLDLKRLDEEYCKRELRRRRYGGGGGPGGPAIEEDTRQYYRFVDDSRQALKIGVFVRATPMTIDEIIHAIMNLDDTNIHLGQLLESVPTNEDVNRIKELVRTNPEVTEDTRENPMSDVDRFWLRMSEVPSIKARIRVWTWLMEIRHDIEYWMTEIDRAVEACDCIRSSEKLYTFLGIVLAIGNYLNYGTKYGDAEAVGLDVLAILDGIRGNRKSDDTFPGSLLMYIFETLRLKAPSELNIEDDLRPLLAVSRFNIGDMDKYDYLSRAMRDIDLQFRSIESAAARARRMAEQLRRMQSNEEDNAFLDDFDDGKERDEKESDEKETDSGVDPIFQEWYERTTRELHDMLEREGERFTEFTADGNSLMRDFGEKRGTEIFEFFDKFLLFRDVWLKTKRTVLAREARERQVQERKARRRRRREELKEMRRLRAEMGVPTDPNQMWVYERTFELEKAQIKHCRSAFFRGFMHQNFSEFGELRFSDDLTRLTVIIPDGETYVRAMDAVKMYLGELKPVDERIDEV